MPLYETKRDIVLAVMMSMEGEPYKWGGNSVLQDGGIDCSGAVVFSLMEGGFVDRDYTSRGLAGLFPSVSIGMEEPGDLLFFNRGGRIGHVEMVLIIVDGRVWTIGASGGGSQTNTEEEARAADARVKINRNPHGWIKVVRPPYED